jgi:hypothetical protein
MRLDCPLTGQKAFFLKKKKLKCHREGVVEVSDPKSFSVE